MTDPAVLAKLPQRGAARRPVQRGVTLIELVVVLVLLGAMAAMAMPNVMVWIRNTEIRNVATSLQAGLQRARAEAMRRNELVRFSLVDLGGSAVMSNACEVNDDGSSWVVSLDNPNNLCGTATSETTAPRILDRHASGTGSKVSVLGTAADSNAASQVTFNGFGRVVGVNPIATIDVDNESAGDDYRALRIVLGPGGTVRMCEPKVSSKTDPRAC
ncbi:MAG: GspH/FimT family pseudopilin [Roseateles sp.]